MPCQCRKNIIFTKWYPQEQTTWYQQKHTKIFKFCCYFLPIIPFVFYFFVSITLPVFFLIVRKSDTAWSPNSISEIWQTVWRKSKYWFWIPGWESQLVFMMRLWCPFISLWLSLFRLLFLSFTYYYYCCYYSYYYQYHHYLYY